MDLFRQQAAQARQPAHYGTPLHASASVSLRRRLWGQSCGTRLPLLLQARRADCGLLCLAMVAGWYRHHVGQDWIRSRQACNERGMTVSDLLRIAGTLELEGRALRLEPEELGNLTLPVILHWDMDHFVVLAGLGRRRATIHDPATGKRQYPLHELGTHFSGIAVELWPGPQFKTAPARARLRLSELLDNQQGLMAALGGLFCLSLLIQLIALLTPVYLQLVIDRGIAIQDAQLLLPVTGFFLALVLFKAALNYWRGAMLTCLSHRLAFQMSSRVFRHLLHLPLEFFTLRHMGDIVSRFGALDNIRRLLTTELVTVVVDGLFSLATLLLLYIYEPLLAMIAGLFVALATAMRFLFISLEQQRRQEVLHLEAGQKSEFMESLRSVNTIKLFSIEEERLGSWRDKQAHFVNSAIQLDLFRNRTQALQNLLYGLDFVLTIFLGSRMVMVQSLSVGQLMACLFLKQHFIAAVNAMVPKLAELRLMRLDLERLSDITSCPQSSRAPVLPMLQHGGNGSVRVQDLSFRYAGSRNDIIRQLSFTVSPGGFLAVSGPSGGGKSTLVNILTGLLRAPQGRVRIADRIPPMQADSLGRCPLAASLHEDGLLAGDLLYNITFYQDSSNRQRLQRACSAAGIWDDILQLPMQFATRVGEMGSSLSAGQMQRLLLARALYREPRVLILDETLSHLDWMLAQRIVQSIRALGITLVLVTHDSRLIRLADMNLVMNGTGETNFFAEDGQNDESLAAND